MVRKSAAQYDSYDIPIHEIWVDDEFNCREGVSRESVESMAGSIEREGLFSPIDVQLGTEVENIPKGLQFRLLCGFRRLTACKLLGWTVIPARVREGLTEYSASFMNLTENLERKDLNILEEALALEGLFGIHRTDRSISKELNKSVSWVSARRHLLLLSEWIQKAAASGRFTESDVNYIRHSINHEVVARDLLKSIKSGRKVYALRKKTPPKKSEIKDFIVARLEEGFSPELLRLLGWAIGEVTDESLEESVKWLRDRKGWLK